MKQHVRMLRRVAVINGHSPTRFTTFEKDNVELGAFAVAYCVLCDARFSVDSQGTLGQFETTCKESVLTN